MSDNGYIDVQNCKKLLTIPEKYEVRWIDENRAVLQIVEEVIPLVPGRRNE